MIVIVPARGGSKGLPGKNTRLFAGEPLIVHTLRTALAARSVTRVLVTTDDDEIMRIARDIEGVEIPVRRPPHLASDTANALDAYLHLIDSLELIEGSAPREVCVLLPTSPLRSPDDIDGAIALYHRKGADAVISVSEAKPLAWLHTIAADGQLVPAVASDGPLVNRQAHDEAYLPNGSVYVFDVAAARRRGSIYGGEMFAHVMPVERAVDIDAEADFLAAEALFLQRPENRLKRQRNDQQELDQADDPVRHLHRAV
ncbi:MAG: acylneuraminate cytidylyltransferase family protein [Alphaproteobacteria bacterium]